MKQDDVKSLLKTTTSQAVEDGAFGVPFIIVNQGKDHLGIENETFFGSDRFEMIANRLGISKTHIVDSNYKIYQRGIKRVYVNNYQVSL